MLAQVRAEVDAEDFRRWFAYTSYAGDSGDQITVWIGSESHRRHNIRFVVAGFGDEVEEANGNR